MKNLSLSFFIFFLSVSYSNNSTSVPINNKKMITDDFLTQIKSNYITNINLGFNLNNYNPRNINFSLIDSSSNGYGLVSSNTRPIDRNDDNWIVAYRQFAGSLTTQGQLGAAFTDDIENNEWQVASNVNSNGNPPWGGGGICNDGTCAQARYPSVVATAEYPIVIWNEYTADSSTGSTYGGRPYYSFDQFEWQGSAFNYPIDIDSQWATKPSDQWVSSTSYSYNINTDTEYINTVFADWTRGGIYLFQIETNDTDDDIYEGFTEEQDIWPGAGSEGTSPYLSINDNGKGLVGLFNSSITSNETSIKFKITEDYGLNWSNQEFNVPTNVFDAIYSNHITPKLIDLDNDGIAESYVEYCINYDDNQIDYDNDGLIEDQEIAEIFTINEFDIGYNGDFRIDSDNNIHIIFSYIPKYNGSYLFIDDIAGYYHLTINVDHIANPGPINSEIGWNWSFLMDGSNTWKFDVSANGTGDELSTTHANISFAKNNPNIAWAVINMANVGDFISQEVEENILSCSTWNEFNNSASDYDNWSMDIYVLKSFDRGKTWSQPINVTDTPGSIVDGIYNGPEEMYPHTPTYSNSDNVFFVFQMPNWQFNEIGDIAPADYMNYFYVGYAGEDLVFDYANCENGVYPDNCGVCGGDNSTCTGCMDINAVNYDINAIFDDESCIYADQITPHYNVSWEGVPNNPMAIYLYSVNVDNISWSPGDEIGVFDGNICVGNIIYNPEFNSPYTILLSENNNNTNVQDGFISGNNITFKFWDYSTQTEIINLSSTSTENIFIPFGNISTDLYAIFGCMDIIACNYNPNATNEDFCIYIQEGQCDCEGNVLDECNICGGEGPLDNFDCDGNCIVNIDCNGECAGSASLDECGICDGEGIPNGFCNCEGNVLDECNVCGGDNSTCLGCTDSDAINYDDDAIIEDGSCEYPNLGDINNDNELNIVDIILMINFILNNEYVFYADLNDDGFLNILDILLLVNWILE